MIDSRGRVPLFIRACNVMGCTDVMLYPTLGCGVWALASTQVSEINAGIQVAEVVGAKDEPQAALHLKLASDQLRAAQVLASEGDNEMADLTLASARVDARLARALSKDAVARHDAKEALMSLDQLGSNQQRSEP